MTEQNNMDFEKGPEVVTAEQGYNYSALSGDEPEEIVNPEGAVNEIVEVGSEDVSNNSLKEANHKALSSADKKDPQKELERALKKIKTLKKDRANLSSRLSEYEHVANELTSKDKINNEAITAFYDNNLSLQIEKTKQKLKQAELEADVDTKIEATTELSLLAAKKARSEQYLNSLKSQQEEQYEDERLAANQRVTQTRPQYLESVERWIEDNPWFEPTNEEYDESMSTETQVFANALETQYRLRGKQSKIGTPEYFQEINRFVKERYLGEEEGSPVESASTRTTNSKPGFSKVSPVRSAPAAAGNSPRIKLTETQKNIARNLGITEERFLARLLANQKGNRN